MNCRKCGKSIPSESVYCLYCGTKQITEKRKALKRANGTGTVYKLSGRRSRPWVASKSKTIIGYYEKKTDALLALERLSGRDLSEAYNMTFSEVFEQWKAEHYKTIGDSGISSYDTAYKSLSCLHGKKFRSLKTADFQAAIDPYMSKSHSTVSKMKQLLTQMSKWAMREEIITTNLASFVRLPEQTKKEKEIFTADDIKKLEEDGSEAARIVLMLIYTGMRINELFTLPISDYHGNYVVGGEKTSAGRDRVIPIRSEGIEHFKYFSDHAKGPLLLSGYTGHHDSHNFRNRDYYALLNRLEIERKSPHSTRHTYASWAVSIGMKPELLQKILGHAKYSTTADIYVHSDIDQLIAAVAPPSTPVAPTGQNSQADTREAGQSDSILLVTEKV